MIRRATLLVASAILGLSGCLAASPESRLETYLRALAGAEADRGWHYLAESTREAGYGNEQDPYFDDVAAADWPAFRWAPATVWFSDDGFSYVTVRLLSPPESVPQFLIARWLLNGVCDGDGFDPVGLGVMLSDRDEHGIGAGGWSGSQIRCNRRFIGDAFEEPPS